MNKYDSLILKIGNEYYIKKGKTESVNDWKVRIIYSLLGRMALASLFDDIDGEMMSITHMKKRISNVFDSYKAMYPELSGCLPKDANNLSDEIYDIYSHTGAFYHMPNRIIASCKTEDNINGMILTRGYELDIRQGVCGLGTYLKPDDALYTQPYKNIFHLEMTHLKDRWLSWTQSAEWKEFKVEGDTEYLRIEPPFSRGYWVNKPNMDRKISILRTGVKGNKLYYLYMVDEDGRLLVSQLPRWLVENYNYRSLANACLFQEGVLPPVTFRYDGDLVFLKFGYLPPPAELYLWKLYTWPTSILELPKDFSRVCTRYVFENIAELLKLQGYKFIEEK